MMDRREYMLDRGHSHRNTEFIQLSTEQKFHGNQWLMQRRKMETNLMLHCESQALNTN